MIGPEPQRSRPLACVLVIVAALWITFGRVCTHEFVGGWDDGPLIVNNQLVNPPTAHGLAEIWSRPHARMYIPVVYSTWWTLAGVATIPDDTGGRTLNPWAFHATNLIVHTLATLIVFAILRLFTTNDIASTAGALLFGLHPLQVEAVAWATGMKDLLSGMLALAALWQYLKSERPAQHAIALLLFALALLAKPATVVIPLIALVIDTLMLQRSWRSALRSLWPWFALIIPCITWTMSSQPTPEIAAPPLWQRPIIALNAIGFYVRKLRWPAELGIDYGLTSEVLVRKWYWIATAGVTVIVAVSRARWAIAALAIFVLGLLPVLGLTPFVFQWLSTVADRYVYLSMLGPAIALAMIVTRFPLPGVKFAAAAVLVALAARSFVQAGVWRDVESLARNGLRVNPLSPAANNIMGDLLFRRGDIAAAHKHFARAVQTRNDFLSARDNLATALLRLNRDAEAVDLMTATLEMKRKLPPVIRQPIDEDLRRLTVVLRSLGRDAEADRYAAELAGATQPTTR